MSETQDYHIIEKFREMVEKRYDFEELKQRFELPESITEEIVDEIETYFLTTIYPPAPERKELEEAFQDLASNNLKKYGDFSAIWHVRYSSSDAISWRRCAPEWMPWTLS